MTEPCHLAKRLIPCLDVRNGILTKGVRFEGNIDIGDPVETARRYYEEGADEIVFYDIRASHEARGIFIDVVERVASNIFIPFSVGGGISSVEDMRAVLLAGAEKISINSAAVKDPLLISRRIRLPGRRRRHGREAGARKRCLPLRLRSRHPRRPQAHGHRRRGLGGALPGARRRRAVHQLH